MVTVLGDQVAAASIWPESRAVVMPETSISMGLMSSMVRPASRSTNWRMISEEVPEETPTVLPASSSAEATFDLSQTTASACESWSKANTTASPPMQRLCAPWPI